METSLFNRLQLSLLAVATAGLVLLAVLNLRQESQSQVPDDGVWWVEAHGGAGLIADKVLPNSPGQRYGIQAHDLLTAVNDTPIAHVSDLERELYHTGVWSKANYTITRDGIELDTPVVVIPEPPDRSVPQALRFIGLIYLAIGVYVLLRRWTAPRATHFYLFCLASFALYGLAYTGAFDLLDWIVFWTGLVAGALQPALFLHFALSFPEERLKGLRRRWLLPVVYAPGLGLFILWLMAFDRWQATGILKHRLDQAGHRLRCSFLRLRCNSVPAQLQPGQYSPAAPAVEVAHARRLACGPAFHAALRHSLPL